MISTPPRTDDAPAPGLPNRAPTAVAIQRGGDDEELPSRPPLLSPWFVVLMVLALAWSAWSRWDLLAVALSVLLSIVLVSKLWSIAALRNVVASQRLADNRVFPGDEVDLVVRVENRKLLPLPWVEVLHVLPPALRQGNPSLRRITHLSLLWHRAATFRLPLVASKRGYYAIGQGTVTSGDVLGLYPRQIALSMAGNLIVYPKLVPLNNASLAFTSLFGEQATRDRLILDPTNCAGTRDYVAGDPMRQVHWKATARQPTIQVKVYEPSTSVRAMLVLAMDSFAGRNVDEMELAISAMASLARELTERGDFVGLSVNTMLVTGSAAPTLPLATGSRHLAHVLETFAMLTGRSTHPFASFIHRNRSAFPRNATIVCFHAKPSASDVSAFEAFSRKGYRVDLCTVESTDAASLHRGIGVYTLADLVRVGDPARPQEQQWSR